MKKMTRCSDLGLLRMRWGEGAYGDYLNAVDDILEVQIGRTSEQSELEYISKAQDACLLPIEAAMRSIGL